MCNSQQYWCLETSASLGAPYFLQIHYTPMYWSFRTITRRDDTYRMHVPTLQLTVEYLSQLLLHILHQFRILSQCFSQLFTLHCQISCTHRAVCNNSTARTTKHRSETTLNYSLHQTATQHHYTTAPTTCATDHWHTCTLWLTLKLFEYYITYLSMYIQHFKEIH